MKLERSQPRDAREMVNWMTENYFQNNASMRSLKECVYFKIAGILHLPVKGVLMLESLAPNPEVKGRRRLLALRRAMDDLRKIYPGTEIVFLTKGGNTLDEAAEFYGFEKLPYSVLRLRPDARPTWKKRARKADRAQSAVQEIRANA